MRKHWRATVWNQRTTTSLFSAKFWPTFNPFGTALIGAPAISNIVFVESQDLYGGNGANEDFKAVKARKRKERRATSLLKETEEEKRIRLDKRKLNDQKRRENEDSTARQARQSPLQRLGLARTKRPRRHGKLPTRPHTPRLGLARTKRPQRQGKLPTRHRTPGLGLARTKRPTRADWSCRGHATQPQLPRCVPSGPRTWKRSGFTVSVPKQAPLQMRSPR